MERRTKEHWDRVYARTDPTETSWYEPVPGRSMALVQATGIPRDAPILDVGAGASTLVDHLLARGYTDVSVLDIAGQALEYARKRLTHNADRVTWIEADILDFRPARRFRLWHDRAVLHFLTAERDRARYVNTVHATLEPGGHVVVATFGPAGPTRCSGLDVRRHSVESLAALFGPTFQLRAHSLEVHHTPAGVEQEFLYAWWTAGARSASSHARATGAE